MQADWQRETISQTKVEADAEQKKRTLNQKERIKRATGDRAGEERTRTCRTEGEERT